MKRVYNFNAGPSAMPLEVLKEVQDEFLDFNGTGMSIVEISHRSAAYQAMQDDTVAMLLSLAKPMRSPRVRPTVFRIFQKPIPLP